MKGFCVTKKFKALRKLAATKPHGFKGSFSFWDFTFKTNKGDSGLSSADFITLRKYAQTAIGAMNSYSSQYGDIQGTIESSSPSLTVNLPNGSFSDAELAGWIDQNAVNAGIKTDGTTAVVMFVKPDDITNTDATGAMGYHNITSGGIPYIFVNCQPTSPLTLSDPNVVFGDVVSHEIQELLVDPQADGSMPEVCDGCTYNCENYEWLNTFDSENNYLGSIKTGDAWPSGTLYFTASVATFSESSSCPAPDGACAYKPPKTISIGPTMSGTSNPVTVTTAAAAEFATITPSTTIGTVNADGSVNMPQPGGLITWTGATNLPDGTPLHFNVDGVADPSVPDTTAQGGTFAFSWIDPVDTTSKDIVNVITVTW